MDGATLKTTMSFCRSLELHTRVHNQAHYLSNKLIENKKQTGYDVHGLFGIFAAGDRINNKSKRYLSITAESRLLFCLHEHVNMHKIDIRRPFAKLDSARV